MRFLRDTDYQRTISLVDLQSLIDTTGLNYSTEQLLKDSEGTAQEELSSYLRQRYDLTDAFKNTVVYSAITYNAGQLVELDFTAFNAANTYAVGDLVSYSVTTDGVTIVSQYICKTAFGPAAWDATKFILLGVQYDLWYIALPYDEFDVNGNYEVGNNVFYKNYVYTCKAPTRGVNPYNVNPYYQNSDIALPQINPNVYPDDPIYGSAQWGTGQLYNINSLAPIPLSNYVSWSSVTPYTTGQTSIQNNILYIAQKNNTNIRPGTDITAWLPLTWTSGDNRNPLLVTYMMDITLYHLHSRINKMQIPELRLHRYDGMDVNQNGGAIGWLKKVSRGEINANLLEIKSAERPVSYGNSANGTTMTY